MGDSVQVLIDGFISLETYGYFIGSAVTNLVNNR